MGVSTSAHPYTHDSKLRSLSIQNDNVRKRLFETGPTNGFLGLCSIDV